MKFLLLYSLIAILLTACGKTSVSPTPASPDASPSPILTTTPDSPSYDPGPYFTPQRSAPEDPATFQPAETLASFQRTQLTGSCSQARGLSSEYINQAGDRIRFVCSYHDSPEAARAAIQKLIDNKILTDEPIFLKFQEGENFLLGISGESVLYAWTHDRWFFLAHSFGGRLSLDAFMQALSY